MWRDRTSAPCGAAATRACSAQPSALCGSLARARRHARNPSTACACAKHVVHACAYHQPSAGECAFAAAPRAWLRSAPRAPPRRRPSGRWRRRRGGRPAAAPRRRPPAAHPGRTRRASPKPCRTSWRPTCAWRDSAASRRCVCGGGGTARRAPEQCRAGNAYARRCHGAARALLLPRCARACARGAARSTPQMQRAGLGGSEGVVHNSAPIISALMRGSRRRPLAPQRPCSQSARRSGARRAPPWRGVQAALCASIQRASAESAVACGMCRRVT